MPGDPLPVICATFWFASDPVYMSELSSPKNTTGAQLYPTRPSLTMLLVSVERIELRTREVLRVVLDKFGLRGIVNDRQCDIR